MMCAGGGLAFLAGVVVIAEAITSVISFYKLYTDASMSVASLMGMHSTFRILLVCTTPAHVPKTSTSEPI